MDLKNLLLISSFGLVLVSCETMQGNDFRLDSTEVIGPMELILYSEKYDQKKVFVEGCLAFNGTLNGEKYLSLEKSIDRPVDYTVLHETLKLDYISAPFVESRYIPSRYIRDGKSWHVIIGGKYIKKDKAANSGFLAFKYRGIIKGAKIVHTFNKECPEYRYEFD